MNADFYANSLPAELFPDIKASVANSHRKGELRALFELSDADAERYLSYLEEQHRLDDYDDCEHPEQERRLQANYIAGLRAARFPQKAREAALLELFLLGVTPREYSTYCRQRRGGITARFYADRAAEIALAKAEVNS